MTFSKTILRKQALLDRQTLPEEEYQKRNASLVNQLKAFVVKSDFKTIHTFLPIVKNREPDVTYLFGDWWNDGRRIMVSKTDFKSKEMHHYWLTSTTQLKTNSWGIPEPINAESANYHEADLIVVPMLLGNKQGDRVGYGGGYYDKLLEKFKGQSVGLSLLPLVDKLETESWDKPLDQIIFP